jgi:DNA repair exonuclease SbcCD ATPase subunit
MALKIKNITIKNFQSIGNVSQGVNFTEDDIVLVLGENLDLGGNDNRNGVGKSALLNALSFALYGDALTKIKKDNLINKVNGKNMCVTLDFEKDGKEYRIERSRKPTNLKFIVNGKDFDELDEAQGDNRVTQEEIERVLNLSKDMFKNIVALNTYSEPFLSMRANEQRAIIEQLLGITKLSEKADKLKDYIKITKDSIKEEDFRIKAAQEANKRIEDNIKSLKTKSNAWKKTHETTIKDIEESISSLLSVDIDDEIRKHKDKESAKEIENSVITIANKIKSVEKELKIYKNQLSSAETSLGSSSEKKCPMCEQSMDEHVHEKVHKELEQNVVYLKEKIENRNTRLSELENEISGIVIPEVEDTYYKNIEDAYNHRSTVESLQSQLKRELDRIDPYCDQISSLQENGLQDISFDMINDLTFLKDHQEFLQRLLTSKDSFIRKKIIDQNLLYLNGRLKHYLDKVGLPHEVKFMSDLEVEISQYGQEYDFDNLSRGERTRLILSLSWAFRDVYESLNDKINLLFVDEVLDNGCDSAGVNAAVGILKEMSRNGRNLFLVSHRDELLSKIDTILKVTKSGGFTEFSIGDTDDC